MFIQPRDGTDLPQQRLKWQSWGSRGSINRNPAKGL